MTQKEYVAHSGCSKGYVSKLVAKGMPLDSPEAADVWRASSSRGPGRPSLSSPPSPPAQPESSPVALEPGPADDTADGAWQRMRSIERAAFGLAARSLKESRLDAARLVQIHAAASSNLVRARHEVLDLREREGRLVRADWIKKMLQDHDGAVATIAKAMPKTLAGRIAPQDPGFAEGELSRWVNETFLATLHATCPWQPELV